MNEKRKECQHERLDFGSGDYYIFCHDCGRAWRIEGDDYNTQTIGLTDPVRIKEKGIVDDTAI